MAKQFSVLQHINALSEVDTKKKKKKPTKLFSKVFLERWLQEPLFADWLVQIPNYPDRCYCNVCGTVLLAGHSELEKHAAGRKHCLLLSKSQQAKQSQPVLKATEHMIKLPLGNYSLNEVTQAAQASCLVEGVPVNDQVNRILFKNCRASPSNIQSNKITIKESEANDMDKGNTLSSCQLPGRKRKMPDEVLRRKNVPDNPDVSKLLNMTDSEDELDDEDDLVPNNSEQFMRQLRAELNYSERELINEKKIAGSDSTFPLYDKMDEIDGMYHRMSERELEARLGMIQEQRRYKFNIYKLELLEMQAKVKLAEEELRRSEELHNLRVAQLQLQINRENEFNITAVGQDGEDHLANSDQSQDPC